MSQEKVEKYKASKKTRKQDIEKAKKQKQFKKLCWSAAGLLVVAALVAALAITIVNVAKEKKTASEDNFRTTSLVVTDISGVRSVAEE